MLGDLPQAKLKVSTPLFLKPQKLKCRITQQTGDEMSKKSTPVAERLGVFDQNLQFFKDKSCKLPSVN